MCRSSDVSSPIIAMCQVQATYFMRCGCLRDTRILKPCPAAFSSLNFSCCGLKNETVVESLTSEEPYCRRCFRLMDRAVEEQYERLRAQFREEGLRLKWPGLELVKALDALSRAEEEELRTLREQCGV